MASSPSSDKAAPECPTYANAMACHPGSTATTTPGAPSNVQLSPLLGALSLHPRTSPHQLTFADWTLDWDNGDNKAPGTDESKDTNLDINGTNETKQDNAFVIDDTVAAAHVVNAHAADNATSIDSSSPPLLSVPPFPAPPLAVKAPPPTGHILLDSGTAIDYAAKAPWMPMPSIGDLSTDDVDPMAKLTRAISSHLAKLDCQCIAISAKYRAFHDLLVKTQTNFDVSAIKRQVRSAVGAHTTLLLELVSDAEAAINVKYDNISALHVASKSALTEALTLLDASTINKRTLATVYEAMMAAVAPGGLMDQCIRKEVTLAVITAVDKIVERNIHPCVQGTLNKIFVSYRD
jgi:hypothetical protein